MYEFQRHTYDEIEKSGRQVYLYSTTTFTEICVNLQIPLCVSLHTYTRKMTFKQFYANLGVQCQKITQI